MLFFQAIDLIGQWLDGRTIMGNNKHGYAGLARLADDVQDNLFGERVQAGRWLIQQ